MIHTEDYEALIMNIDDGDLECLPILADMLEEQGNDVSNLRWAIRENKRPIATTGWDHRYWWGKASRWAAYYPHASITDNLIEDMEGHPHTEPHLVGRFYDSIHEAYLALVKR